MLFGRKHNVMVFSACAEVVPIIVIQITNLNGILRVRGGSSSTILQFGGATTYSPRARR